MIIKTIKVSEKGQIAIPREIRHQMNIDQGDELIIVQDNGKILIEKTKKFSKKIEDDFSDIAQFSQQSLKEVWDNKEDDVWNEYLKHNKKK
jgi:AbrB family looped-hinge helix DNA binding protein